MKRSKVGTYKKISKRLFIIKVQRQNCVSRMNDTYMNWDILFVWVVSHLTKHVAGAGKDFFTRNLEIHELKTVFSLFILSRVFCLMGYRHLSLKIANVKFNINPLMGQNLTSNLKIRVLIIACKWVFDVRFWPISALMSKT